MWRVPTSLVLLALASIACAEPGTFTATAYSQEGRTASGTRARPGVVAADPDVLPLGSRIRVSGAGPYSGEYVVEDTGPAVDGRHIDIYVESASEARRFGRRTVEVEILDRGDR